MKFECTQGGPFGVPYSISYVLQAEVQRADEIEALDEAEKVSRKLETLTALVCKLADMLPDDQQVLLVQHVSDAWKALPSKG